MNAALSTDWIYHITPAFTWQVAQSQGCYIAPSLDSEGFIHCSYAHQVQETAALHFANSPALVLLAIDPFQLTAPLKLELSRNGEQFPHLYGALNLDAVVRVLPFTP